MRPYQSQQSFWLICLTMTAAFVLAVLPLPELLRIWRPNIVLLVLLIWLVRYPQSIGVGGAWWVGLIYDGVVGCPLGLHALSFTLSASLLLVVYPRWRLLPTPQQIFSIILILIVEQALVNSGQGVL